MKWTVFAAAIASVIATFSTTPVYANDVADVVRARANARAGGGTSGHDAWILQRYGKLSGSGRSSRHSLAKKKASKKRALLLAKKKKAAAAKRRALLAAKKKEAERRAYLLAKKKAEKKQAIALAKKKKEAEKRAKLAASKEEADQQKLAAATPIDGDTEGGKTESTFVTAPSTSALITSQEIAPASVDQAPTNTSTDVAVVETNAASRTEEVVETKEQDTVGVTKDSDGTCKKFLPAIGLTISVGC